MNALHNAGDSSSDFDEPVGLVANVSVGKWDIAIDQTLNGPEKWFAQIEGPSLYLYFQIGGPRTVECLVCFLEQHTSGDQHLSGNGKHGCDNELKLSCPGNLPVAIFWDGEGVNRCYFSMGTSSDAHMRCGVFGDDLDDLTEALRQLSTQLNEGAVVTNTTP